MLALILRGAVNTLQCAPVGSGVFARCAFLKPRLSDGYGFSTGTLSLQAAYAVRQVGRGGCLCVDYARRGGHQFLNVCLAIGEF